MPTFRNPDAKLLWIELHRIANAIEALLPTSEPEPDPTICLHPDENRISLGMTNGVPEWECNLCQHREP